MSQPVSFLNGKYCLQSEIVLSIDDLGVLQGVAVSERVRTFRGELFRLDDHLERLFNSLDIIDVTLDYSREQIRGIVHELVGRNGCFLQDGDDLSLALFATPGTTATARPTLGIQCNPLPFGQWASYYTNGQALTETSVRQVPASCWPLELKCRSRMHYYLADRLADKQDPGSRAILLDQEGIVSEASTANVVFVGEDESLVSPPLHRILPGVSLAVLQELAESLGIAMHYRDFRLEELAAAAEILLCSTSPCVWPVTRLNSRNMSMGVAGPVYHRLLQAWSELVGLDIAAQAQQFADRC